MNNDQIADVFIKNYGKTGYSKELSEADNLRFVRALVVDSSMFELEKLVLRWGGRWTRC